jgi:16S rRNA (cytosine967-C5)-methyltransferase
VASARRGGRTAGGNPTGAASGARGLALETLLAVLEDGRSLAAWAPDTDRSIGSDRESALARELVYGVLRWLPRLDALLERLLDRPLRRRDADLRVILLLGLHQLFHTRVPDHAAVSESVSLARARGKTWAAGLVNAALRRAARERETLDALDDEAIRLAHPGWMASAIREAWPGRWEAVLEANNERAPMTLRVNRLRCSRADYLARLTQAGIGARPGHHGAFAVLLDEPLPVMTLPGFEAGEVSVQDEAAQLGTELLAPSPGDRVLDACAAPGGKSALLLESQPALGEMVAVDSAPVRVARLADSLERLGLRATVLCADAMNPSAWWDGRPFERILVDAPCTGTGVVRRHPDIKALRRPGDADALAATQRGLLEALWPLLSRAGSLLYATCSVLPRENDAVVRAFLSNHPEAEIRPLEVEWGEATACGRQILPGDHEMDGFFYALLARH